MQMLREAGFQHVERRRPMVSPASSRRSMPGAAHARPVLHVRREAGEPRGMVFAALGSAARRHAGPRAAVMGRGAVNQKGPQSAFLAALHAIRGAGLKLPVNLVLVAEGEEEIGSPHFDQVVHAPPVRAALAKCDGVFMPEAAQGLDGNVTISLGAKGVVELELVSSGEKWGRGPTKDIHSSNRARIDSPAWHLVQALHTLVDEQGEPAIDGYMDAVRPLSASEQAMLDVAAKRIDERPRRRPWA